MVSLRQKSYLFQELCLENQSALSFHKELFLFPKKANLKPTPDLLLVKFNFSAKFLPFKINFLHSVFAASLSLSVIVLARVARPLEIFNSVNKNYLIECKIDICSVFTTYANISSSL